MSRGRRCASCSASLMTSRESSCAVLSPYQRLQATAPVPTTAAFIVSGCRLERPPGSPPPPQATSVAADLLPGNALVDLGLARQAQDALAHLVAQDLRGATLDGVGPSSQKGVGAGLRDTVAWHPGNRAQPRGVHGEAAAALVELRVVYLAHRAFRPRRVTPPAHQGRPKGGYLLDLLFDVGLRQALPDETITAVRCLLEQAEPW